MIPSEMNPTEIDTELARLDGLVHVALALLASLTRELHEAVGDRRLNRNGDVVDRNYRGFHWEMKMAEVLAVDPENVTLRWRTSFPRMVENYARRQAELAALRGLQAPLDAEFDARQWSRFFEVSAGHIHSSTGCSTCNNGQEATRFGWCPELSGLTEADAVAARGPKLCTVCFPSAPTAWTNFYEAEAAAKVAAQCPGSGTYDYDRATARLGYYTGNYGRCNQCGENVTVTKTEKLRAHKAKKS